MGFFSSDTEALIDVYQCETTDLIKELDDYLAQAEHDSLLGRDEINGIFRVVHTIKSSSAMMGMEEMSSCTHHLEDLFLLFRENPPLCRGNEKRIFDLMYAYSDFVKDEIEKITEEDYQPTPPMELTNLINRDLDFFMNRQTGAESAPAEIESHAGKTMLDVRFKENCPMVNVRAFLLLRQIGSTCGQLRHQPEDLKAADAAALIKEHGLLLEADSSQAEEVGRKFSASPYVESVETRNGAAPLEEPRSQQPQPAANIKTSKFCTMPWERIVSLQEITEEFITSHTILENTIREMGTPRELENFSLSFRRILNDLEELANSAALTPVSSIRPQLNRIVRDICKNENKEVDFHLHGENIEADKNLIDTMLTPLMHLLRNAIDHGIESPQERKSLGKKQTGQVTLDVTGKDGTLVFSVSDDGRGIDPERILKRAVEAKILVKDKSEYTKDEIINLVFTPGFSTVLKANEYSGRGVGMDVVRNTVDSLGGVLEVQSEVGCGSKFIMQVPVSMTSVDSIRFTVGRVDCLLPVQSIDRVYSIDEIRGQVYTVDGQEVFQSDSILPVLRMNDVFGLEDKEDIQENLLVLQGIKGAVCIIIGRITGQLTAVEKKLPQLFGISHSNETGIAGCAVIGDGALGMVLSAEKLIQLHQKGLEIHARAKQRKQQA